MKYTSKDFKSDQEVRWCPGCGDHAVLAAMQRAMPRVAETLGYEKERFVVVSGIGCSSRLPYYMDTDALAIGGNHFIHAVRRNIDINIILFNNQIYGLTKGQYSPTSKFGAITKTSPYGTVEHPFNPGSLVLGAKGTFFARGLDTDLKLNEEILYYAATHNGTSVVEMLTNCVIFNDGAHSAISDRAYKEDRTIVLRHGRKMIFGKDMNKGLVLDGLKLKVVTIGEKGITEDDILTHDVHSDNVGIHMMLADMKYPDYPVALGVIRDVQDVTYDGGVRMQAEQVTAKSKIRCMDDLLCSGSTWEVK